MSMDPQDWTPGQEPDGHAADRTPARPVAPYTPADTAPRPYGGAAPVVRDPYAYDPTTPSAAPPVPVAYPEYAPGYPQPVHTQPVYTPLGYSPTDQPSYSPAGAAYPQSAPPPYPTGPYPQPYVQGAYGQRSAYGEYTPTSYGASGYQPMPFAALPALAGWGVRVGASLIDSMVPMVLVVSGLVYFFVTDASAFDAYGNLTTEPSAAGVMVILVAYLLAGIFSLWNRTFLQGRTGQSLGKRALHIRLVRENTMAPPGPLLTFGRELAHQVDGAIYIGYLWPLWDAKNQTLADKICSTVVIADG